MCFIKQHQHFKNYKKTFHSFDMLFFSIFMQNVKKNRTFATLLPLKGFLIFQKNKTKYEKIPNVSIRVYNGCGSY